MSLAASLAKRWKPASRDRREARALPARNWWTRLCRSNSTRRDITGLAERSPVQTSVRVFLCRDRLETLSVDPPAGFRSS